MTSWEEKLDKFIESNKSYPNTVIWLLDKSSGNYYAEKNWEESMPINTQDEWLEIIGVNNATIDNMRKDNVNANDLVVVRKNQIKYYYKFNELSKDVQDYLISKYNKDQINAYAEEGLKYQVLDREATIKKLNHGAYLKNGCMIKMFWD